jgi:hypothetical protein
MASQQSFYQNFWEVIKYDLLELFSFLHSGQLELFRLNFGEIILLHKINEAERIQQYRPICLLNVSFKISKKVATIKLNTVAGHVVRSSQIAFMQGRNILDGVSILHETVHERHSKKLNRVILKIDLKKPMTKSNSRETELLHRPSLPIALSLLACSTSQGSTPSRGHTPYRLLHVSL